MKNATKTIEERLTIDLLRLWKALLIFNETEEAQLRGEARFLIDDICGLGGKNK